MQAERGVIGWGWGTPSPCLVSSCVAPPDQTHRGHRYPPAAPEKALTLTAGPVPGSQICQHDSALPQAQARVPFLFPAWGFSCKVFIRWSHWLPWLGGAICQTRAFMELGFPKLPFLSLQKGYQGPQHPKGALA